MNADGIVAVSTATVSKRLTAFLLLTRVAALVFVGAAAMPYYLSSAYGPHEYAPGRGWLMLHISVGSSFPCCKPIRLAPLPSSSRWQAGCAGRFLSS
jgi:hypothetical protein